MARKASARVLLADDHPAVTKELCALLQPEFDVIATVGDGDALVAAAEALAPDVIVTDIAMPGLDGVAAASDILRRNPAARIVFVTVQDEAEIVKKGLAIGVLGYVLKLTAGEELVTAIHAALRGERHISRPQADINEDCWDPNLLPRNLINLADSSMKGLGTKVCDQRGRRQ